MRSFKTAPNMTETAGLVPEDVLSGERPDAYFLRLTSTYTQLSEENMRMRMFEKYPAER